MTYKLWFIYENDKIKYYVINKITREIQSSWINFDVAKGVVRDLNRHTYEVADG